VTHRHPRDRRSALVACAASALSLSVFAGIGLPGLPGTPAAALDLPPVTKLSPGAPMSGRSISKDLPILAVKIDNVRGAFPQAGLNSADVIYVEEVEGGLTRLMAVFSSRLPRRIGPVRSARTDNIQLLAQFGTPELAYSGANRLVLREVHHSTLRSAEAEALPQLYRRDSRYANPHNLFLTNVRGLLRARKGISTAKDIGLRFDRHHPGGRVSHSVTVRYRNATLGFAFDRGSGRWRISQDGQPKITDGVRAEAASVVIQSVRQLKDVNGAKTPFNETIGFGPVKILRDGKVFQGTWLRPTIGDGTLYLDSDNNVIPVVPGVTWVVLLPRDARATYR
jgi:hypothetical protein